MWIDYEEIRRMSDNIRAMCGDDQDTFLDTLDGETDAMDILGALIKERNEVLGNEAALERTGKAIQRTRRQNECQGGCNRANNGASTGRYGRTQSAAPIRNG